MPNFLMIVAILLLGVCLAAQGSPPRDAAPGLSQSTREMSNRVARMEHANASKPHPRSRPGPAGPHGKQAMPSRARALRRLRATRRRLSQATETSPAPPCPSSPPPEGAMAPQGCPWPPPAFCEAGVDNDSSIGTEPLPGCPGGDPLPLATDSYFPYGMDYYYDWDDLVGEFLCPTTEPGEGEDPAMRLGCTWPAADICSEPWDGYYGIYYGGFDDGFYGEMPPWYGYDGEDTWDFEDYFEESDDFFDSDDVRERMDDGSDDFFEGSEPGDYYYDYYDLDLPLWDYYGMAPPDYLFIHPGCPGGLRVSCCFPEADPGNCMPEDCSFDIDYAPFDFGAEEGASFFPGIEEDDWGMPLAFDGTSGEPRTTAPEERPSECWRAGAFGVGSGLGVGDYGSSVGLG